MRLPGEYVLMGDLSFHSLCACLLPEGKGRLRDEGDFKDKSSATRPRIGFSRAKMYKKLKSTAREVTQGYMVFYFFFLIHVDRLSKYIYKRIEAACPILIWCVKIEKMLTFTADSWKIKTTVQWTETLIKHFKWHLRNIGEYSYWKSLILRFAHLISWIDSWIYDFLGLCWGLFPANFPVFDFSVTHLLDRYWWWCRGCRTCFLVNKTPEQDWKNWLVQGDDDPVANCWAGGFSTSYS